MPPEEYTQLVIRELENRARTLPHKKLRSIYFGGGTPSLIPPDLIVSIIDKVASHGFQIDESTEITIEINPATVTKRSLSTYLKSGINRFSVGAQTFNDRYLKACGREHSASQTRDTLDLLKSYSLNFSFDLLFALPQQSLIDLEADLNEVAVFQPQHLSAYCLTVPSGHAMSRGRPPEDEQVAMFELIEESVSQIGLNKYEISNFARPGYESRHNQAYWDNTDFWGLGLSAHSYVKDSQFGTRFWNPKTFSQYAEQVHTPSRTTAYDPLPENQYEKIKEHEAMTDFSHMHLRTMKGLSEDGLLEFLPLGSAELVKNHLEGLVSEGLLRFETGFWKLSESGMLLSNKVFERLTFLQKDLT